MLHFYIIYPHVLRKLKELPPTNSEEQLLYDGLRHQEPIRLRLFLLLRIHWQCLTPGFLLHDLLRLLSNLQLTDVSIDEPGVIVLDAKWRLCLVLDVVNCIVDAFVFFSQLEEVSAR